MIALLPGRFQPWHRGHQLCIEEIRNHTDTIIIGLRPQGIQSDDFLSVEQRIEIIKIAVPDAVIVAIEDTPHFNAVFTCNPKLQEYYRKQGRQVVELPRYGDSATEIRRRLELGLDISDLVVPGTAVLIRTAHERQRVLYGRSA